MLEISMQSVLEKDTDAIVEKMQNHLETVCPGLPFTFSEASTEGDRVWQGDLGLTIAALKVPDGYVKIDPAQDRANNIDTKKLVPGFNPGSMHCLESLDGVEVYRKPDWNTNEDNLMGPFLVFNKTGVIEHPKHGNVTVPAGFSVICTYQREYDAEQQRIRRNAD